MSPRLEVIVGTYEQFLLGYTVDDIVNKYKMERSFATHSHVASIRSIATNKHYLASAAADDTVCLYDMRYRAANGKLVHHNDTVNCISFTPDGSHLISGSSDGTMAVVRCGNWQMEKQWPLPHKGHSVDVLAIHPSGKMALTTGGDGVLRTWNLIKGRQAYATNLVPRWKADAKYVTVLKWNSKGDKYLIAANNKIDVYSVENAGIINQTVFDSKVVCIEFLDDELFAVGLTDGRVTFYDIEEGAQTFEILAHDARVKCMARQDDLLVTASSAGEIKLWCYTKDNLTMLNKANCNARISCLALSLPCVDLTFKKEIEVEETVKAEVEIVNLGRVRRERVIIEDEGNVEKKKKSIKKKKRRKNEVVVVDVSPEKKQKILLADNPKKRKSETIEVPVVVSKKKKKRYVEVKKRKPDENNETSTPKKNEVSIGKKKRKPLTEVEVDVKKKKLRKEVVNAEKKKKKKTAR